MMGMGMWMGLGDVRRNILVQDGFISFNHEFNPFIDRFQMTIGDYYCDFDNLVFESV